MRDQMGGVRDRVHQVDRGSVWAETIERGGPALLLAAAVLGRAGQDQEGQSIAEREKSMAGRNTVMTRKSCTKVQYTSVQYNRCKRLRAVPKQNRVSKIYRRKSPASEYVAPAEIPYTSSLGLWRIAFSKARFPP
jgi:hypothetical protein